MKENNSFYSYLKKIEKLGAYGLQQKKTKKLIYKILEREKKGGGDEDRERESPGEKNLGVGGRAQGCEWFPKTSELFFVNRQSPT